MPRPEPTPTPAVDQAPGASATPAVDQAPGAGPTPAPILDRGPGGGSAPGSLDAPAGPARGSTTRRRDEVDHWFVRRGVPHFIEGYSARTDVWTRALPTLSVLFVLGVVLELGLAAAAGVSALLGGLALVLVCWLGVNRLRRQPLFALPQHVGRVEPALFVVVPVVVSALRGAGWFDVVATLVAGLALLGTVYLAVSYGLAAMTRYAVAQVGHQLRLLGSISSRAVPMLLLITMTIFITGETWQMAAKLRGLSFAATLGLFVVVGGLFLWTRVPGLVAAIERFDSWAEVAPMLVSSPLAGTVVPDEGDPVEPPINRGERLNMAVLVLTTQAVQITLVAAVVWLFFVLLGFLAVHPETSTLWLTEPSHPIGGILRIGQSEFAVTTEGLRVAAFLAAFAGLTFTVYLVTDETYRREFRTDVTDDLRQLLAVRLVDRLLDPTANPAVPGEPRGPSPDASAGPAPAQRFDSSTPSGSTSAAT